MSRRPRDRRRLVRLLSIDCPSPTRSESPGRGRTLDAVPLAEDEATCTGRLADLVIPPVQLNRRVRHCTRRNGRHAIVETRFRDLGTSNIVWNGFIGEHVGRNVVRVFRLRDDPFAECPLQQLYRLRT